MQEREKGTYVLDAEIAVHGGRAGVFRARRVSQARDRLPCSSDTPEALQHSISPNPFQKSLWNFLSCKEALYGPQLCLHCRNTQSQYAKLCPWHRSIDMYTQNVSSILRRCSLWTTRPAVLHLRSLNVYDNRRPKVHPPTRRLHNLHSCFPTHASTLTFLHEMDGKDSFV
jgi:hypothetical protein